MYCFQILFILFFSVNCEVAETSIHSSASSCELLKVMDRSFPSFGFGNTSDAHVWMEILFQLVPARLELDRLLIDSDVVGLDRFAKNTN